MIHSMFKKQPSLPLINLIKQHCPFLITFPTNSPEVLWFSLTVSLPTYLNCVYDCAGERTKICKYYAFPQYCHHNTLHYLQHGLLSNSFIKHHEQNADQRTHSNTIPHNATVR